MKNYQTNSNAVNASDKEELFEIIKCGYIWSAEKIKFALENVICNSNLASSMRHSIRFDSYNKTPFVYDNDCYLIIYDGKIELRSDRENTYSYDQHIEFDVSNERDVYEAYNRFVSMPYEGDD
jgi:hypothetical protein